MAQTGKVLTTMPNHIHRFDIGDYNQSLSMKMHQANIIISVDHRSNVELWKNRYSSHGPDTDISVQETVNILAEILSRQIFGNYLNMFRESLKEQLIKSMNKTIKEGVYK